MKYVAIKEFEITEGSTDSMWYRIEVRFKGIVIEVFERPSMQAAQRAFEDAGYVKATRSQT